MAKEAQPRMTFEIDGERFSTLDEFYDEFSKVVIPGVSWGHNLDALNDVLYGGMGTPDDGFILAWRNSAKSRSDLGHTETVRQLERRLTRCHPSHYTTVTAAIDSARRGEGETVLDWLVDIFKNHDDIEIIWK
jgi:RNAse (barnase) inhibitor barstar